MADTLSLSSKWPSLATSACKLCYDPAHFTLGCSFQPWRALSNNSAVHEGQSEGKNNSDGQQRLLYRSSCFCTNFHYRNDRHPSFHSKKHNKISQPACIKASQERNCEPRKHARKPALNNSDWPHRHSNTRKQAQTDSGSSIYSCPVAPVDKTMTSFLFCSVMVQQKTPGPRNSWLSRYAIVKSFLFQWTCPKSLYAPSQHTVPES